MVYTNIPIEVKLESLDPSEKVVVTHGKKRFTLQSFQKADGLGYFRFSSPKPGVYAYQHGDTQGTIHIKPYPSSNPLYQHGPIQVSPSKTYLQHQDGTPFLVLADTWWFGMTSRTAWPQPFQLLVKKRKEQGFSAVQVVIGIPPEVSMSSQDAENEGGLVWLKPGQLNPAYFDAVDKRIAYLVDQGMVPIIYAGWGHHIDWVGIEATKLLWKEILARYATYPVIWCLCGEVDGFLTSFLPVSLVQTSKTVLKNLSISSSVISKLLTKSSRYLSALVTLRKNKKLLATRLSAWNQVAEFVQSHDSFNRILTVHPQGMVRSSQLFPNASWLTLDGFQSGHSQDRRAFIASALQIQSRPILPIINLEPWYEGILDNFKAPDQRYAFWMSLLSGACGHAYGAHGIWQMASTDAFMKHWGKSDWRQAIQFPGSLQLGKAKQWLEMVPWQTLKPNQSLVTPRWSSENPDLPVAASIANWGHIVYIPSVSRDYKVQLHIHLKEPTYIYWLDPASLTIMAKDQVTGKPLLKIDKDFSNSPDRLILIKN